MQHKDRDPIALLLGLMEGAFVHLAYEFAKTDRAAAFNALQAARLALSAQVSMAEASGRINSDVASMVGSQLGRLIETAQTTIGQAFH